MPETLIKSAPSSYKYGQDIAAAEIPGTRKPGQTGVYRNIVFRDTVVRIEDEAEYPKTAYDNFERGLRERPDGNCFGHRPWNSAVSDYDKHIKWETYTQIAERRTNVGSALTHLAATSFTPSQQRWFVGLWTLNRPEWQIASLAASAYSLATVSLYETLGPNVVEYCINHAEIHVIFSAPSHIPALLALSDKCPTLKVVVSLDNWDTIDTKSGGPTMGALPKSTALKAWGAEKGIQIFDFQEIEQLGKAHLTPHIPPQPDDICSIYYTSGTTGMPKGAVLSHRLLAACAVAGSFNNVEHSKDDVMLSFLPLSHIFARFIEESCMVNACPIAYALGDPLRLLEDCQIIKPTVMISVPRILNRLYGVINSQALEAPGLKGALARRAFKVKLENFRKHGSFTHPVWDRLVMNKVKAVLGGRLKLIGTGSAPLSPTVIEFLQVAFCCPITEGYGQTEGGGVATKNVIGDYTSSGLVGPPQVTTEIKLVDVPDMGYRSTDTPEPRGEMYVRGQNVFTHYYKEDAKTKEAFTEDGWFKTGDIASVDHLGRFRIVDRVKNLIKLAQGEYVAVEKVENVYSTVTLGAQLFIYADSLQNHLILFVVPDPASFCNLVKNVTGQSIDPTNVAAMEKAGKDPKVLQAAFDLYNKEAKKRQLNGFETAKQFAFRFTPFSIEEDTLTPTLKIKRNIATKLLKSQADELYAAHQKSQGPETRMKARL